MKNFIKNNKLLLKYLIVIFILSFIFTILEYMGVSYTALTTILLILNVILSFIYSFKNGKNTKLNGYKSGIISASKLWIMFIILNIITLNKFTFKSLIYYLIIMSICIIGGIIGKNKQKNYSS
ncbi:MAG: DUF3792 family protein [Bacilli bacterium]|nr:DUF3792 family protein [Bacilli bacterium]